MSATYFLVPWIDFHPSWHWICQYFWLEDCVSVY